jgi:hypothetical protein
MLDEATKKSVDEIEQDSNTATEVQPDKENGKAGGKVEDINLKLIQKTTGYLQELCREIKEKGGVKK